MATASITSEFEKVPAGREIKTFLALWAYPWFFVSFGGYILLGADYQASKYIDIVNTGTLERNQCSLLIKVCGAVQVVSLRIDTCGP